MSGLCIPAPLLSKLDLAKILTAASMSVCITGYVPQHSMHSFDATPATTIFDLKINQLLFMSCLAAPAAFDDDDDDDDDDV